MGEPMARNLLKAGYKLHVHSRTRSKAQHLLADGASWEETPQALAQRVDVVISIEADGHRSCRVTVSSE